jgi:hypothetical protein
MFSGHESDASPASFRIRGKRSVPNAQVMDESDAENRNRLETELRAVQAVSSFYCEAIGPSVALTTVFAHLRSQKKLNI